MTKYNIKINQYTINIFELDDTRVKIRIHRYENNLPLLQETNIVNKEIKKIMNRIIKDIVLDFKN